MTLDVNHVLEDFSHSSCDGDDFVAGAAVMRCILATVDAERKKTAAQDTPLRRKYIYADVTLTDVFRSHIFGEEGCREGAVGYLDTYLDIISSCFHYIVVS